MTITTMTTTYDERPATTTMTHAGSPQLEAFARCLIARVLLRLPIAPVVSLEEPPGDCHGMSRTTRGPLGSCGGAQERCTCARTVLPLPPPLCSDRGGAGSSGRALGQRRSARCPANLGLLPPLSRHGFEPAFPSPRMHSLRLLRGRALLSSCMGVQRLRSSLEIPVLGRLATTTAWA